MELREEVLTISNDVNKFDHSTRETIDDALNKVVEAGNTYMIMKILYAKRYLEGKLCYEIAKGNIEAAKILIEAGVDVHTRDNTPIKTAVEIGSKEIFELIKKEIERLDRSNLGKIINKEHLLASAAWNKNMEMLKLLRGIDGLDTGKEVTHAIEWATHVGCIEAVNFLVENIGRGYINDEAIMLAVEKGYTQIFELFLKEEKSIVDKIYNEETLLEVAAKNGHIEIVRLLIKKMKILDVYYEKTTLNAPGYRYSHIVNVIDTAIMFANKNGHSEIVELLEKTKLENKK